MEIILYNNIFMCLYLSLATGTAKGRVRKKALLVLTYRKDNEFRGESGLRVLWF